MQLVAGLEGRVGDAVYADELGGDALAHLGVVVRLAQDRQPGVRVQVYEAGAHDEPGGVDNAPSVDSGGVPAVDGERVAFDDDMGPESRRTAAVDDQPVLDKQVSHCTLRLSSPVGFALLPVVARDLAQGLDDVPDVVFGHRGHH